MTMKLIYRPIQLSKKLRCALFGHKMARSRISYWTKQSGFDHWVRFEVDGEKVCKRCKYMAKPTVIDAPSGDYTQFTAEL